MKLAKAIEILTLMGTPNFQGHTEDILAARKLGIKSLERIEGLRSAGNYIGMPLLKGETKE